MVCGHCDTWHVNNSGLSSALKLPWLAAGWILPDPESGWGECHTKIGCAGCTLCLSPSATGGVGDLPSALAVNHCWYLHSTWFLEELGVFLWLLDVWKFQCVAHRSEKLDTSFLRLVTESHWVQSYAGPRRWSPGLSLQVNFSVCRGKSKAGNTKVACFCENQTGSLTCHCYWLPPRIVWFCSYYSLNNKPALKFLKNYPETLLRLKVALLAIMYLVIWKKPCVITFEIWCVIYLCFWRILWW